MTEYPDAADFLPGDVVVLIREMAAEVGATGTVFSVEDARAKGYTIGTEPERWLYVEWDRSNDLCRTQMDGGYYPRDFRLHLPQIDPDDTRADLLDLLDSFTTDEERERDLKDLLKELNS